MKTHCLRSASPMLLAVLAGLGLAAGSRAAMAQQVVAGYQQALPASVDLRDQQTPLRRQGLGRLLSQARGVVAGTVRKAEQKKSNATYGATLVR